MTIVIIYTAGALALGVVLVFLAVRALHHQELERQLAQAEWEARYHQQETEIALSVSRSISNTIAARLAAVYGRDYADYLIARQMSLQAPEQRQPQEQMHITINRNSAPSAIDLYADEHRADERQRRAREREREYSANVRHSAGYTPPHEWQPKPQAPYTSRPIHAPYVDDDWHDEPRRPFLPHWADDDVLDVDVYPSDAPVYPPALLAPPPTGRQRKYASNAERQRAYRARQRGSRY
ncbi:hypothetical protein LNQ82_06680 [Conchiformibius steedae DSM 2580]|uniref:Uncharacterized protein n=1 Tax=Conchiformibius steedae DSM 2580 TaxID=1121352 RepID=A0AAE9HVC7_9NEIS|nr:hypothetical protein [Conchiformibius steedae]QMT34127.1 hypothetical protein H3L98_03760 [Conchiformibius steedae]URD66900.1 hypothetical protein LNQ82_06680 [Conchiformibius steedae DSM 2580]